MGHEPNGMLCSARGIVNRVTIHAVPLFSAEFRPSLRLIFPQSARWRERKPCPPVGPRQDQSVFETQAA
jgi:hypothetical protein